MFSVFGINVCNRRLTVVSNYTSGRICYKAERRNDIMGSKRNLRRTLSLVIAIAVCTVIATSGNLSDKVSDRTSGRGLQMRTEAILPENMEDYLKFFGKKQRNK